MFRKVLVANRGEIAVRIVRTLQRLGVASVAVYSDADIGSPHVANATEAVGIGPAAVSASYLRVDRILDAARGSGAEAVHPGYGLLSENADFAESCEAAGIAFVGPTPDQIRSFGLKHTARQIAQTHGVPLLPGTGLLSDVDAARVAARTIGYPVILKSVAGGGGIGMRVCDDEPRLLEAFDSVRRSAAANFASGDVYLERFVRAARHVEVQIVGDGRGEVYALGERDCSAQRRNQKVVEETPAPRLNDQTRRELHAAAVRLARAVNYRSAGTVEFVLDAETQTFYFLEVNTRLQVEHPVTEAVTGLDLVELMLRIAAGEGLPRPLPPAYPDAPGGCSIEARLYAEDPAQAFRPCAGVLTEATFPPPHLARVDTWVSRGTQVTPHYDPLLAKVIVHAPSRPEAVRRMAAALDATRLGGIETNLPYLRDLVATSLFVEGRVTTGLLRTIDFRPDRIDVLTPGDLTTVQDYPGRLGLWDVGVPPSGPMDTRSFRLGNRVLGNPDGAAGLEMTVRGPTLRFGRETMVCLTGAQTNATLDGVPVPRWRPVVVPAEATLAVGAITSPGFRAYLLVRGGLDTPQYLGSRSTFTLGGFGGHAGRALRVGDVLHVGASAFAPSSATFVDRLPDAVTPKLTNTWELGVLIGPHASPDFFTDDDIERFFAADWKVHHQSARTGVRLIGPKPRWARTDGGDAGLHPSNLHDNAYAIGAVDFTGDMPVLLGPDGPSLGGFVCPAVVVSAELWKLGQLRPGDTVRFRAWTEAEADAARRDEDALVADPFSSPASPASPVERSTPLGPSDARTSDAVLARLSSPPAEVEVAYRRAGDAYVLVEYGPMVLDLELRLRVGALLDWLTARRECGTLDGLIDLTPGIRSLQIHYDPRRINRAALLDLLRRAEDELPPIDELAVPSRIVHLPLSWDDPATREAIERYTRSVRADAPWCPSNIEFIRRINGLTSTDDVKRIVFDASYLVLGLGDVYLGAPVATPIDPRHRLVTTKYNPARTWTPENAVGIGGAYLCVYGMEGPGGYQFVGRTVPVWNTYRQTADFEAGKPWLLRFFDQIRFYPVSAEQLLELREGVRLGRTPLRVEPTTFSLREHRRFLKTNAESVAAFRTTQRAAFDAERARWASAEEFEPPDPDTPDAPTPPANPGLSIDVPAGATLVASPMTAGVWKVQVRKGQRVEVGDVLVILEAMKMETTVPATVAGQVLDVLCQPGLLVEAGQPLVVICP